MESIRPSSVRSGRTSHKFETGARRDGTAAPRSPSSLAGTQHLGHAESIVAVQLRREPYLHVPNALGEVILGELIRGPLQVLGRAQHGTGVLKATKIVRQVCVTVLKY